MYGLRGMGDATSANYALYSWNDLQSLLGTAKFPTSAMSSYGVTDPDEPLFSSNDIKSLMGGAATSTAQSFTDFVNKNGTYLAVGGGVLLLLLAMKR